MDALTPYQQETIDRMNATLIFAALPKGLQAELGDVADFLDDIFPEPEGAR